LGIEKQIASHDGSTIFGIDLDLERARVIGNVVIIQNVEIFDLAFFLEQVGRVSDGSEP
jgi:hypothetical protein